MKLKIKFINKKAFTLIELLAVIVILAVIALIAVPIMLNVISDSKNTSNEVSIKMYLQSLENYIASENLNTQFSPQLCIVENSKLICDDKEFNVTESSVPSDGFIGIKDGKIVFYYLELNGESYEYGNTSEDCFAMDKTGALFGYGCEDDYVVIPERLPIVNLVTTFDMEECIQRINVEDGSDKSAACEALSNISTADEFVEALESGNDFIDFDYALTEEYATVNRIFRNTFSEQDIQAVILPDSIEAIDMYAFARNKLIMVKLPKNLRVIGNSSFAFNQIKKLEIPSNVTSVEPYAFFNNKLSSVTIPDNVSTIGQSAFSFNKISKVDIGSGIQSIGKNAFEGGTYIDPKTGTSSESNKISSVNININKNTSILGDNVFGWIDGKTNNDICWKNSSCTNE